MATKRQYDLEVHLGHIITFLLHLRKFILLFYNLCCPDETVSPKNWRDKNCNNLESDIDHDIIR